MWFPGSRLVVEVEARPPDSLRSLLSRCIETRLTGYLEVLFPEIEVIVLFQNGDTVQVVSESQDGFHVGRDAVIGLARLWRIQVGATRIYEMPEELGRMLCGLHNRVELARVFSSEQAKQVLERMKTEVDTGAVELYLKIGNAIVLLTGGECVNCYLRTESGSTFENGEALDEVFSSLDLPEGQGRVFLSTYSSEIARTRVCTDLLMKLETLT